MRSDHLERLHELVKKHKDQKATLHDFRELRSDLNTYADVWSFAAEENRRLQLRFEKQCKEFVMMREMVDQMIEERKQNASTSESK